MIMQSHPATRGSCNTCNACNLALHRLRPLHHHAFTAQYIQGRPQKRPCVSRRNPTARAQAQSEKAEQEASASAEGAPAAEQKGQLDNVPSPSQEQLPNQKGVTVKMSQEDLNAIKKAMQKQKGAGGGEEAGFVEGILEEVKLITWPNPLQALSDTLVVIAIVLGTAVTLFAVNSVLADVANLLY
ncbi:hypothetical protein CVIRNUC_001643 [Coccomyxa viridis]|uniref:Preprotein translocase subunit SecE n=1 Tax=Coccomyxa viridis TaxID=1274662 RepID=A0AAV1HTX8_9CHLO|nr:hypothetical protein CVIRNUC_001643 [Coccomyxa viridis]